MMLTIYIVVGAIILALMFIRRNKRMGIIRLQRMTCGRWLDLFFGALFPTAVWGSLLFYGTFWPDFGPQFIFLNYVTAFFSMGILGLYGPEGVRRLRVLRWFILGSIVLAWVTIFIPYTSLWYLGVPIYSMRDPGVDVYEVRIWAMWYNPVLNSVSVGGFLIIGIRYFLMFFYRKSLISKNNK